VSGYLLHLMRHGEPEGAGRLIGHTDALPTAAGLATCVAKARGLKVGALIASDLARARCAGEAIAKEHSVALRLDPRWRELDFGAWDGQDPAQIDMRHFWDDPDAFPPPGGERWSALVARVSAALGDAGSALVITHAGAMRAALAALCGLDARTGWALDLPYAALLTLRVWPGKPMAAQIVALS